MGELDPSEWQYRGEGAFNIVLSYCGEDPALRGKVLRLRKLKLKKGKPVESQDTGATIQHATKPDPAAHPSIGATPASATPAPEPPSNSPLSIEERRLWSSVPGMAEAEDTYGLMRAYSDRVMAPLLGPDLVEFGELVEVSEAFLCEVSERMKQEPLRPQSRKEEGEVDLRQGRCIVITDLTLLPPADGGSSAPTICVEIKPKCGFLATSKHIAADNRAVKASYSRYQMHQALKLSQGQVHALSAYNPVDLFSGDKTRMRTAFGALLACPQNNLHVFHNGDLVFGSGAHPVPEAPAEPSPSTHSQPPAAPHAPVAGGPGGTELELALRILDERLRGLVEAEQHAVPQGLSPGIPPAPSTTGNSSSDDGNSSSSKWTSRVGPFVDLLIQALHESKALERLLRAQELDSLDVEGVLPVYHQLMAGGGVGGGGGTMGQQGQEQEGQSRGAEETQSEGGGYSREEAMEVVRNFLIAATAKDCGVMVSLRRAEEGVAGAGGEHKGGAQEGSIGETAGSNGLKRLTFQGQQYEFRVQFLDLDLKHLHKIPKYYELDQQIVACFKQTLVAPTDE